MILLITSVPDATSDLFVSKAVKADVFRLNIDCLSHYTIRWTPDSWHLSDPTGRYIDSNSVSSMYWRKPFTELPRPDDPEWEYGRDSRRAFAFGLADVLKQDGVWALVDHRSDQRTSKLLQLAIAKQFFAVPETRFVRESSVMFDEGWITKPIGSARVGETLVLPTRRIPTGTALSEEYCWLVQREVVGKADVTVVSVCGEHRAFRLERESMSKSSRDSGIDWRVDHERPWEQESWVPMELCPSQKESLSGLMTSLDLKYCRTDFLEDAQGTLWFLETNPNGQFAWLDLDGSRGLLDLVFNAATKDPGMPLL